MAETSVFQRLEIYSRARGGTLLAWQIHPLFVFSASPVFEVKASRSAVGDWLSLGTAVNTYSFLDTNRWIYGKGVEINYMVSFVKDGITYESEVVQPLGNLNDRDKGVVREMGRKEQLRNNTMGSCGYLYKRRKWGVKCPVCLDYNTS